MLSVTLCSPTAQLVYMLLDPPGWRERHMGFAERYAELFQEISDALDKPASKRRAKGGPPISTLVSLRRRYTARLPNLWGNVSDMSRPLQSF